MKTVIMYASVHHNNTKDLVCAIAAENDIDVVDATKITEKDIRIRMIWIMQRLFSKSWKRESDLKVSSCILYTPMHKKNRDSSHGVSVRFV